MNEEALAHWGLSRQKKKKKTKSQGLFHVPTPFNLIKSTVSPENALALATIALMPLGSVSRLIFVRKNQRILCERETVSSVWIDL
jgi:hypothetical protein